MEGQRDPCLRSRPQARGAVLIIGGSRRVGVHEGPAEADLTVLRFTDEETEAQRGLGPRVTGGREAGLASPAPHTTSRH